MAEFLCSLDTTGTYTILAGYTDADDTGTYGLYLQRTEDPANAEPIDFGEPVSGTIEQAVVRNVHTFSATTGQQVQVRMAVTSGELDPEIQVYQPDGSAVCSDFSFGSEAEVQCALDSTATYAIFAGDVDADQSGTYDLILLLLTN